MTIWLGKPLQGPWVAEYRLPLWSGDYHFNVNVQECYWPAFAANHPETLMPLVQLLERWQPKLHEYAAWFVGIEDGLQLPHAVDDRCTCMGNFWTGSIDHGSTAWTGQLLWLYYQYTADVNFLRETAYPFLKAVMRVYEVMLEDTDGQWHLPIGISPEFGGADISAWGPNASYQLAAIHFLCRALIEAAEVLDVDQAQREHWRDIDRRLPSASTDPQGHEIYIWDGQSLSESHLHHSHLAGIYPFDTLEYGPGGQHEKLVYNSLHKLTLQGMGAWTGWCVPWASILFARTGNGEMAELLLQIYRRVFMNQGYASLFNAAFPGFTVMYGRGTIMQIEATLGAAAAVLEILVHTRSGVLHIFPAIPADWPEASFKNIRAPGAFLCSAEMDRGQCRRITIHSEAGQTLRLANPWPDQSVVVVADTDSPRQVLRGAVLQIETQPGQTLTIKPE